MSAQPISLDPTAVAKRVTQRYQRIVGELVEEVAQLTAYAAELEQQLAATQPHTAERKDPEDG